MFAFLVLVFRRHFIFIAKKTFNKVEKQKTENKCIKLSFFIFATRNLVISRSGLKMSQFKNRHAIMFE